MPDHQSSPAPGLCLRQIADVIAASEMRYAPRFHAKPLDKFNSVPIMYDPNVVVVTCTTTESTVPFILPSASTQLPSLAQLHPTGSPLRFLPRKDEAPDLASTVIRICTSTCDTQFLDDATQKVWDRHAQLSVDRHIIPYRQSRRPSEIDSFHLRRLASSPITDRVRSGLHLVAVLDRYASTPTPQTQ